MADQLNEADAGDAERITEPSPDTVAAERREAVASHEADRVEDEESLREAPGGPVSPSVSEAEEEMARLGIETKGEGRIS